MVPDQPIRIHTVCYVTRLLRMHVNPSAKVKILRDSADNWFARGTERKRVRMVVVLGIARATVGSEFGNPRWNDHERYVAPQPAAHQAAFQEVARAIGISRQQQQPRE